MILLSPAGCVSQDAVPADEITVTRTRFLMGTPLTISVDRYDSVDAIEAAFTEVARIERLISTWRDDSLFSLINAAPVGITTAVPVEVAELLASTVEWSRRTGGAFDPAAGRLVALWDLRGEGRTPDPSAIEAAVNEGGSAKIAIDTATGSVTRLGDVTIEEGGFGKGYALDRAIDILRSHGVESAMLDFGGQVSIIGPSRTVAIADPGDRSRAALELTVPAGSLATSSGSERFFPHSDGTVRSHLLDPRSGEALPPRGSASVWAPTGLEADVLATALYVLGPAEAMAWADEHGVAAIIITKASSRWTVDVSAAAHGLSPEPLQSTFQIERTF